MARPSPTFYVFHGRDEFTRAEMVADLQRRLAASDAAGMNTARLDGRRVTLAELRHACEAVPFLSDRRMVIVEGLLTRLHKERGRFLEQLVEMLPRLPDTTRLILVEDDKLPDNHPVLTLIGEGEHGYVRLFDPPADKALPGWIEKRARKHGGAIRRDGAVRLAQLIGADLRLLDQELLKLITYRGAEGEITLDDIAQLVPYAQEAVIFDLVDALGQRKGEAAATTLQRLLDAGSPAMGIMGMIVRQFRLLIQVRELREAGENAASVARILQLHTYPAGKLHAQAANFSAGELERIYRHLLAIDVQIKSGEIVPEIALDLLVAGLSGV